MITAPRPTAERRPAPGLRVRRAAGAIRDGLVDEHPSRRRLPGRRRKWYEHEPSARGDLPTGSMVDCEIDLGNAAIGWRTGCTTLGQHTSIESGRLSVIDER